MSLWAHHALAAKSAPIDKNLSRYSGLHFFRRCHGGVRRGSTNCNGLVRTGDLRSIPVRSCKVTIKDLEGVDHTVDVNAATLYEAVALGIAAIRSDEWVTEIAQGLNTVKVRVMNVAVEHEVRLKDFTSWLDRNGGSPREMLDRQRIKSILGMRSS